MLMHGTSDMPAQKTSKKNRVQPYACGIENLRMIMYGTVLVALTKDFVCLSKGVYSPMLVA